MPSYLVAFALTIAIEVPAYLLGLVALHRIGPPDGKRRRLSWLAAVLLVILLNLLTHPALWWLFSAGYEWTRLPAALPLAEVIVALLEGLLLFAVLRRDAGWLLLVAVGANAASYGTGMIIQIASSGS